jgi:fumarylacetoacetase
VAAPKQEPAPLPYLRAAGDYNYDIALEIALQTKAMRGTETSAAVVSQSNARYLYWTMAQQLAHATSNGATISPGDLFASGTISGSEPGSFGSFIELTWRGERPIKLAGSEERSFLEDGDIVTLTGRCEAADKPRIGFGSVSGTIVPAR